MPTERSRPRPARFVTSLGPVAVRRGSVWTLDLSQLPIFHGLSVLARALTDLVVEQIRTDRVDVAVERPVNGRENPELLDALGVTCVKVCGEHSVLREFGANPERLEDQLRALLGTIQRRAYREALFPSNGGRPKALVFHFEGSEGGRRSRHRATLEPVCSATGSGRRYLRITIDVTDGRRLALASLPHLVVRDLHQRTFIAGATRIAQTWRDGIVREAERGRRSYTESARPHSHLFTQLAKAGLEDIVEVAVSWSDAFVPCLLEDEPDSLERLLKNVLLALEDRGIRAVLAQGHLVRILRGDVPIFVDRAQLGRTLHISLGQPRERADLDGFLERMPRTAAVTVAASQPLRDVKILLIHHITAEVAGFIAALRAAGCRDLVTLFVAYAGEPPGQLLGPLLDLPPDEFSCLALANVPEMDRVEGHYRVSSRYSRLDHERQLADALAHRPRRYADAMRAVAVVEFMRLFARAEAQGQRCLLVEDGGYLAPALNAACLEGRTVRDLLRDVDPASRDERPLAEVLAHTFIGSVEHTRNGFDRLEAVERQHGRLAFPAFSIAVSRLKRTMEAYEVGASVLNAVENVLHATGKVLSRRTCLVLGSRGSVGSRIVRSLNARLQDPSTQLLGVDLQASHGAANGGGLLERGRWADLPACARARLDLVVGVTGARALTGADVEDWLAHSAVPELILASGSTKTVEFAAVADWLDRLFADPQPRVCGRPAGISTHPVVDPQTGRVFGHRYRFALDSGRERDVTVLANLTPVNFLFYGVPTEAIDEVMAQLLECAIGLVGRAGRVVPRLHAVDRDMTADGQPLAAPPSLAQTPTVRQYSAF